MSSDPPSGTVTFLFTDIQGSTKLAQEYPDGMPALLARHNQILTKAIEARNGLVFRVIGDSFSVSFHNASDALQAALDAQRSLRNETWSPAPINVRMGIHTGAAQYEIDSQGNNYSGYATLALAQRIMSAGHGGQVLISQTTYELTRDSLPEKAHVTDLGERRLKDILRPEHIYQVTVSDLPSEFPPIQTLDSHPNNLPLQLTSFVGREKEIGEVKALLENSRLVTLAGSGGTGKSRLSQEVGGQVLKNFSHGVWWIELAPLSDEAQMLPALAQAFGLQVLPFNPLAQLVLDYLRDKKLLLILDNCEHLIEACARLADDLLHQCAGLKILASSREALGIAGEVAYRVPSMADSESTQLFVDRARAVNASFKQTDANASAIAQICHRLDGIPLAIELAAARSKLLSVEQIATRLDNMFRLLIGGSRTALPRQQTLRALIDWSYDLLSVEEQRLLQSASVLVGGWTLEALEAVADQPDTLELLEHLVNKSLVVTEEREHEMRYFMLETIRQYAREKLFDAKRASAARDRHFVYFDELSDEMWDSFRTMNGFIILRDQAFDEFENMRAAVEWGVGNHPESVLRLAANFAIVSSWTGSMIEGLEWLKVAINQFRRLPPVEGEASARRQALLSKALFAQGMVGMATGGVQFARQSLDEAIAISRITGDKRLLGYSLEMYYIASAFVDTLDAAEYAEEGFAILNELDDPWLMSMGLMNMARIAGARGEDEASDQYFGLLRTRMTEAPLSYMSALTYLGVGYGERARGHLDAAKQHFEEGWEVFKQLRHRGFENVMLSEIGHIARIQGETSQAESIYRQTIVVFQDLGNRAAVAHQLECFASLALSRGESQHAAKLYGAAEALRERTDSQMNEYEHTEYDGYVRRLHSMLPEAELSAPWVEGRALTMEQAIQLALS